MLPAAFQARLTLALTLTLARTMTLIVFQALGAFSDPNPNA